MPPPQALPADASAEERLEYDKENLWPGLISEFRKDGGNSRSEIHSYHQFVPAN
jgi:hypothetical protein